MNQTIPVTALFPPDLEKQARIEAAKLGISRSKLVCRAVVDYLQRLPNGSTKSEGVRDEQRQPA